MKLWFKYLAGVVFGLAIYLVAPKNLLAPEGLFYSVSELALRIGYYPIILLLAVNLPLSILKLSEEKKLWRLTTANLGFNLVSLIIASLGGIALALVSRPERLPLLDSVYSSIPPELPKAIHSFFPYSFGEILTTSQEFALPILALGGIVGLAMAHDPAAARPLAQFLDSLSRVLYTVATFLTEILGVLLIPMTVSSLSQLSTLLEEPGFREFLAYLSAGIVVLLLFLVPSFIHLARRRKNPFPILYSALPSLVAALVSGSVKLAILPLIRQQRENLGIKRRFAGLTLPLGIVTSRAGSVFVASFSFVVILYSYSPLMGSLPILLTLLFILPISAIIASVLPESNLMGILAIACVLFGRGLENGYRILLPAGFILGAAASLMDILWIAVSQTFGSGSLVPNEPKSSSHFI